MLDVVRRTVARLAALHADDGTKRALVGTAATSVETSARAERTLNVLLREERALACPPSPGSLSCGRISARGVPWPRQQLPIRAAPRLPGRIWRHPCPSKRRDPLRGHPASTGIPTHESLLWPPQFQLSGTGVRCRGRADIDLIERRRVQHIQNGRRLRRDRSAGTSMRVLVSSINSMSMAVSGPSTRRSAQSAAMPYTAASEFDGVMARHHRITYPSSS
jgi:hypothetical protein